MPVSVIKSLEEFHSIINSGKVVYIDFHAVWCGPCKVISPAFEELSNKEEAAGAEFYKVDVDEVPDVAQEVGVKAMPTFVAFKHGIKLDEFVGAVPGRLKTLVSLHHSS